MSWKNIIKEDILNEYGSLEGFQLKIVIDSYNHQLFGGDYPTPDDHKEIKELILKHMSENPIKLNESQDVEGSRWIQVRTGWHDELDEEEWDYDISYKVVLE